MRRALVRFPVEQITPTQKAKRRQLHRRPLTEKALVEANVLEYPLWALANRDALPTKPDPAGGFVMNDGGELVLDKRSGKPILKRVVDTDKLTKVFEIDVSLADGSKVTRRVKLEASHTIGYPTILSMEVLVYLCQTARRLGLRSQYVPCSLLDIARALGRGVGGSQLAQVLDAVVALEKTTMTFHYAWCRETGADEVLAAQQRQEPLPPNRVFLESWSGSLVDDYTFKHGRPRRGRSEGEEAADGVAQSDRPKPVGVPDSYVKLGDCIWWNLLAGYTVGVDSEYLYDLKSPVAKRMYSLLTKRDDQKDVYEENLYRFCKRLGLSGVRNAGLAWARMKDAIADLKTVRPNGKVFLADAVIIQGRGGAEPKIQFVFARAPEESGARAARILDFCRQALRQDLYDRWFGPMKVTVTETTGGSGADTPGASTVVLFECPTKFHCDFINDNYVGANGFIPDMVAQALGREARVTVFWNGKDGAPSPQGEVGG